MLNAPSEGTLHSNAPATPCWGLKGSADAPPGKGVSPAACAGAGGIVGSSYCTAGLGWKGEMCST